MSDVTEKLQELQESMQQLQLLKSIGAQKLIQEQEKEIYHIQQEILDIDENIPIDVESLLPKKCRFCDIKETADERLECYEIKGEKCKRKPPEMTNILSLNFFRFLAMTGVVIASLFVIMLLTNILMSYLPEPNQKLLVFVLCAAGYGLLTLLFWKPVRNLFKSL